MILMLFMLPGWWIFGGGKTEDSGQGILVDAEGTEKIPEEKIEELVRKHFPLRPRGIIEHLDLLRPIYKETARHGHFGRSGDGFTWEKTDMAETLRKEAGL